MKERSVVVLPGLFMLLVNLALYGAFVGALFQAISREDGALALASVVLLTIASIMSAGFFIIEPGGSKVLLLFGKYLGTVRAAGFHWTNPFATKREMSLRVRTFNGERLKVNDAVGNPVEIAVIVVWKVTDTYSASFDVDNYEEFVVLQTETALRHIASSYPYDADEDTHSLRRNAEEVSDSIKQEVQDKLHLAGVEVMDARISHLAYAPEIASAMLRRQQAAAVIAARQKIVDGAVGMVEMALERIEREGVIKLDDERKAAMVSNLMVVLCGETAAQPIVNTGTLYTG